jgi:large subunit ribosomal protein L32e
MVSIEMIKDKERLMNYRKHLRKIRPRFRRVESWRYIRVKNSWRKPSGIDSKTRRKWKAGVKSPNIGYRSPKSVRNLHPSGFIEVYVITPKDLEGLNPKIHAIRISSKLGAKKRIQLIEIIQEKEFKILNLGVSQKELEELEEIAERGIALGDEELELEEGEEEFEVAEEEEEEDEELTELKELASKSKKKGKGKKN